MRKEKILHRHDLTVELYARRFNESDFSSMILCMVALVFIMGPRCSTLPPSEMIGIIGNGNSAIIINGVSYNISSIFTTAADAVLKKYRSGWVFLAFALVSLTIISTLLLIRLLLMRNNGNNRKFTIFNWGTQSIGIVLVLQRSTPLSNKWVVRRVRRWCSEKYSAYI